MIEGPSPGRELTKPTWHKASFLLTRWALLNDEMLIDPQARAIRLLEEFQVAWSHARCQPSIYIAEGSDSSEEDDVERILHAESALKASTNGVGLLCPHAGCTHKIKDKKSLNRHFTTHYKIKDRCPFCQSPYDCLRYFIKHVDRCGKKQDDGGKMKTWKKHKADLYEASRTKLARRLQIVKHSQDGGVSATGYARGNASGPRKGVSRQGTSGTLGSRSHDSVQKEERRRFPKRRRIGTNGFSGTVISVQSNQSHRLDEEDVAAEATRSEAVVLCDSDVRADSATLQPESSANSPDIQGQAIGSLTGDVYELTPEDLQAVAVSDQIQGQIRLTDPYEQHYSPFILTSISKGLRDHFTSRRRKLL
ncbi:MAG: hypothetical protein Q9217_006395 [Psora testacea]